MKPFPLSCNSLETLSSTHEGIFPANELYDKSSDFKCVCEEMKLGMILRLQAAKFSTERLKDGTRVMDSVSTSKKLHDMSR
ncbi:hypothetical protein SLA2020_056870 [Shorea laevis]